MQTFSPVESSMPIQDPEPVKEAEKPDGEKGNTYQHSKYSMYMWFLHEIL